MVENALKHGLSPQLGPGHLWITARRDNGRLWISIEDDGVGLPPGLSRTEGMSRQPVASGVGLDNVRRRLETR
ncbi:ATP-binding protein [Termitidicoccus mucosus]|uniref:sensor histidine kinase n=1 Tax=Termitidicoccus mucosus TaxID=1184151 RepID=UPI0009FC8035